MSELPSTKKWIADEMKNLYEELTDPVKREEAKRLNDRKLRIEDKKLDSGII